MLPNTKLNPPKSNPTEPVKPCEPDLGRGCAGVSESAGASPGDSAGGELLGGAAMGDGGFGAGGRGLGLTAMTTVISFWPLLQLSALPLMKKKGPE